MSEQKKKQQDAQASFLGREEKYFQFTFSSDTDNSINVFDFFSAIALAKNLIEARVDFSLYNMCPRHEHRDEEPCTDKCHAFIRGRPK